MRMSCALVTIMAGLLPLAALAENLLANPDFDEGIASWEPTSDAEMDWNSRFDIDGEPDSGSLTIKQVGGDGDAAGSRSECFTVVGGAEYTFGGGFYVVSGQPGTPHVIVGLSLKDGPDCTGDSLVTPTTDNLASVDDWFIKSRSAVIDALARSARIYVNVFNGTTDGFKVSADALFVHGPDIFEDGFEDFRK